MKKISVLIILVMSVVSCELFDAKKWEEYDEWKKERGIECYRRGNGTIYCEDKYGNPV